MPYRVSVGSSVAMVKYLMLFLAEVTERWLGDGNPPVPGWVALAVATAVLEALYAVNVR